MKIVYNACFGGFSLSDEAYHRYAELKGLKLYPEKAEPFSFLTYWTVPKSERKNVLSHDEWRSASDDQRRASNEAHSKFTIYDRDIERNDPILVQVVEELGDKANGMCARLRVVEIPEDARWEITEYDGSETVREPSNTWA